jgi:hypothetical protein
LIASTIGIPPAARSAKDGWQRKIQTFVENRAIAG